MMVHEDSLVISTTMNSLLSVKMAPRGCPLDKATFDQTPVTQVCRWRGGPISREVSTGKMQWTKLKALNKEKPKLIHNNNNGFKIELVVFSCREEGECEEGESAYLS